MSAIPKNRDVARSIAFDSGIAAFDAIVEDRGLLKEVSDISAAMAGFSAEASLIAARSVDSAAIEDSPAQLNLRASYLRQWATLFIKTADNMNAEAAQSNQMEARYDA